MSSFQRVVCTGTTELEPEDNPLERCSLDKRNYWSDNTGYEYRYRDCQAGTYYKSPEHSYVGIQYMTFIHEMFRKKGKARQHNLPKAVIFQRKN